ncbi:hypothetical protein [Vibrio cionasavignyae]|uniref:hypothetical protein n=1 Tax=Vibrio cionasavignyae TaxID=2910252 RepID=UPI003D0BA223
MKTICYSSLINIKHSNLPQASTPIERLQASMTQPYRSQMCGAYSLVASAITLGVLSKNMEPLHITNRLLFEDVDDEHIRTAEQCSREAILNQDDTFAQWAEKVYSVTGIVNLDDPLSDCVPYSQGCNNGNSPSAMIMVARQLGIDVQLRVSNKMNEEINSNPRIKDRLCVALGTAPKLRMDRINFTDGFGHCPENGQLGISLMSIISNDNVTLANKQPKHWITRCSDNTYFDSLRDFYEGHQYGRVGAPWAARPYTDTGMEIILSKNH